MQKLKIAKRLLDCVISGTLTDNQENAILGIVAELAKAAKIPTLDDRLREVYYANGTTNKIAAIKMYRDETGNGLGESKDYVEKLFGCYYVSPQYGLGSQD